MTDNADGNQVTNVHPRREPSARLDSRSAGKHDTGMTRRGLLRSVAVTPSGGSATTCTTSDYDDLDRLKRTSTDGAVVCGGKPSSVTYAYDGVDRQRSQTLTKTVDGTGAQTVTTRVYDGLSKTATGQSKAATGDDNAPDNLYELTPEGKHVAVWQAKTTGSAASLLDDNDNRATGPVPGCGIFCHQHESKVGP